MDGSAIFGIYKSELLNKYNIRFTRFFHEDVFFMFLVYWFCNNIKIINEAIYKKQNCKDSITNSIGICHIDGFFLAYDRIYNAIKDKYIYLESYNRGLVGVVAVKLRDIKKYILDDAKRYALEDIKNYKAFIIKGSLLKVGCELFLSKFYFLFHCFPNKVLSSSNNWITIFFLATLYISPLSSLTYE